MGVGAGAVVSVGIGGETSLGGSQSSAGHGLWEGVAGAGVASASSHSSGVSSRSMAALSDGAGQLGVGVGWGVGGAEVGRVGLAVLDDVGVAGSAVSAGLDLTTGGTWAGADCTGGAGGREVADPSGGVVSV